MADWRNESTDKLCEALLTLETKEDCYKLLDDLCTIAEIKALSQRLSVALLLAKKESYLNICSETGASSATISRVNKCLEYGSGGYQALVKKLNGDKK